MKDFKELGLKPELIKALDDLNIVESSEIQEKAIPFLLKNEADFVGLAKTGTGKTAAFALPLLQLIDPSLNQIQALVLVPTRELGNQVLRNIEAFSAYLPEINLVSTLGGVPIKPQIQAIKSGAHLIVATPGRLLDLIDDKFIDLSKVNFLVVDEADEMLTALSDGFREIAAVLPKKRRTWLFSATMPTTVKSIVNDFMGADHFALKIDQVTKANENIDHQYMVVNAIQKLDILTHFLNEKSGEQGIIFCKTKAAVNKLAKNLAINKFSVGALHGSLAQPIRERTMDQFKNKQLTLLVASDLASRGLDVEDLSFVVNYHLPDVSDVYVHRTGRTARAGKTGLALTIIQEDEIEALHAMENEIGIELKVRNRPAAESLEENNALLWATKIFKTRPNHDISKDLRTNIHSIFHHLTKEELIDKLLSGFVAKQKDEVLKLEAGKVEKKKWKGPRKD
jgi:ATP-dependent RNA helicase DeaD